MSTKPDKDHFSKRSSDAGGSIGVFHPDVPTLHEFLAGRLLQSRAEEIESHLSDCLVCARVFEAISLGQDQLIARLRSAEDSPAEIPAPCYDQETIPQRALEKNVSTDANTTAFVAPSHQSKETLSTGLPQRFGRYQVECLLGRGGFGEVYRAWDDDLHRPVAIKVTFQRFLTGDSKDHYLAEARTVARLDHPNIVPVYDVGQGDNGDYYVVSKLIEGTDLSCRMTENRISREGSVSVIASIAEALHYAHTQGLVHRDVKPGNILLDSSGRAFLADFGIALSESQLGKGEGLAGTINYMSPEQARGEGHRVDGRSDIYSLGVVLYELLTGRRPFQSANIYDLLALIADNDVKPPRQIDDSIPPELERICLKALSRTVKDRYSTARDFADELRSSLSEPLPEPSRTTEEPEKHEFGRKILQWTASFQSMGCSVTLALGLLTMAVVGGRWAMNSFNAGAQSISSGVDAGPFQSPSDPGMVLEADPKSGPIVSSPPPKVVPLEILSFEVHHFAAEGTKVRPQGVIGRQSFGAALGDEFNVQAKLSRPAYSFLIVFRADGQNEVLYPQDDTDVPELTEAPHYPSKRRDERFVLEEGSGQWVVALIVSETPLPSYRDWLALHSDVPWRASEGKHGTVAWDDGQLIQQLEPGSFVRGSKSNSDLAPIARLTEWLRDESGSSVQAIGFTVK